MRGSPPPLARPKRRVVAFAFAFPFAVFAASMLACEGDEQPADVPQTLPCDVARVLVKCQTCHTLPPKNGAPITLVTFEDTQRLYFGVPIWKLMGQDVKSGRMPLALVTLEPTEREAVVRWAEAGGRPGAACP